MRTHASNVGTPEMREAVRTQIVSHGHTTSNDIAAELDLPHATVVRVLQRFASVGALALSGPNASGGTVEVVRDSPTARFRDLSSQSGSESAARGRRSSQSPKGHVLRIRGKRLHDARIAKNMTIRDLAERSRIDAETIASLETGREEPPLATVRKLADALGIAVEDLVMWGGEN